TFNNPDFPFDRLPRGRNTEINGLTQPPLVFDTWSQRDPSATFGSGQPDDYFAGSPPVWNAGYGSGSPGPKTIPLNIRGRGGQIEMRVWDQKSQTTRQITIIQDL